MTHHTNIMHAFTLALTSFTLWFHLVTSNLPPSPPPFSWDTIPLFIHAMNESGALNDTAARYMASFPIATVEKSQGQDNNNPICSLTEPCEEDKIINALSQIRSHSSDVRTLFYLNSIINFPQYNLSTKFTGSNEKYLLHDRNGKLIYLADCHSSAPNYTVFDVSYNETRNLWLDTVYYALTKGGTGAVDGIFADRARANTSIDLDCVNLTQSKADAWNSGHITMIQDAMKLVTSINPARGIVMCNGADYNGVNGRMYENFEVYDKNSVPAGNDISHLIKENGIRITEIHEDDCTFYSTKYNSSLAAYLIGAYNGSYYACTQGWTIQQGWDIMWQNKDFSQPLGKPLGNATYNSTNEVYYREFEKGVKVWIDFEWKYPCIKWSDGSVTGTTDACNKY